MVVAFLGHLSKTYPSETERDDASLGEVDAPFLFVFGRISLRFMADHIQDRGDAPTDLLRFVENGRRIKTGNNLVEKLAYAVAIPRFSLSHLLEVRGRLHPFGRPSVKSDVVQDMLAQLLLLVGPVVCTLRGWQRRDATAQVLLQLKSGDGSRLDWLLEQAPQ